MSLAPHLFVSVDRVFYDGWLGQPGVRVLGAHTIYAAAKGEVCLTLDAAPAVRAPVVSVPPFTPHRIVADERWVRCFMMEPEFIQPHALMSLLGMQVDDAFQLADWSRRIDELAAMIRSGASVSPASLDVHLWGQHLPRRELDLRITRVIQQIQQQPSAPHSAQDCAAACHLSTSRFMHLFKSECGVSFRTFKTWKRARSLLHAVDRGESLTTMAHELGYSDSAYFSHSIRHFTGLRPKDIVAGSRHLRRVSDR